MKSTISNHAQGSLEWKQDRAGRATGPSAAAGGGGDGSRDWSCGLRDVVEKTAPRLQAAMMAAAVRVADSKAVSVPARSSLPRNTPSKNAPVAPTPPASVGVKKPPYKPPMTNTNNTKGAHTSFKPAKRWAQLVLSPRGSQSGRTLTMMKMVDVL